MKEFLCRLKTKVDIGMVGGSDYSKAQEQLGGGEGEFLSQDFKILCLPSNEMTVSAP